MIDTAIYSFKMKTKYVPEAIYTINEDGESFEYYKRYTRTRSKLPEIDICFDLLDMEIEEEYIEGEY